MDIMIPKKNHVLAFSIVEVMIALGILIVGAFGAYEQFIKTNQLGLQQYERIQARYLALQELEQLRATPYPVLAARKPNPAPDFYLNHPKFVYCDQVQPEGGMLALTVQVGWDILPASGKFTPGNSVTVKGLKTP